MNEEGKSILEKSLRTVSDGRSVGARTLTSALMEYGKVPPQAIDLEEAVLN
jgi:hypothetical protein